jgi:hypothetical protein
MVWTELIWLRIWIGGGLFSCEHGNEPRGSIKWWEILEYLSNWRPLRKYSAP